MRVRAFAKINLSLRVLGTRPDGYHELRTIFQSIALHDTLTIRRVNGPLRIACDDPSLACDRTNLVWRAADALWRSARRRGTPRGIAIDLEKRIPRQAGLGGGSSDAAATLRALEQLWRVDPQCVREAAVRLGADVPFFLEGGTVLGLERGDVLFPLIDRPRAWVVVVAPSFGISTPDAYRWFDEDAARRRQPSAGQSSNVTRSPDGVAPRNDLEASVSERHPEIARIVRALLRAGAASAAMSGSGSAVFGLFDTRAKACRAATSIQSGARRTFVTRTVARAEYRRLAAN
jgi:4-diphosphocytidyl-2-C-methyl-D-erythritol kinase